MIYIKGIEIILRVNFNKNISLIADKIDGKASILPEPTQQKDHVVMVKDQFILSRP